jgi:hypothetical protein
MVVLAPWTQYKSFVRQESCAGNGDAAYPHGDRPIVEDYVPVHDKSHDVQHGHHKKIDPATIEKVF